MKLLDLYNNNEDEKILKLVMKKSFATNEFYNLFLEFLNEHKGRRFSLVSVGELSKEFVKYCEHEGLDYSPATIDMTFHVLYHTFILANFLIKRYFENTKKIDLILNITKLQDLGFLNKPKELSKWPLPTFADELLKSFNSTKGKIKIKSEIQEKKMESVSYKRLRSNVITRLNRKFGHTSESEKLFDSLFFVLMNKNPNLIETQKLIKETKVILHSKNLESLNLW